MKGPGIIITLTDPIIEKQKNGEQIDEGLLSHYYGIRDYDFTTLINELRAAGAEAISINGQRIINMSEIRGIGDTGENIIINGKRIGLPYVIKAIGNADYLESQLSVKGGYVDELRAGSIEVNITKDKNILIEKYDKEIDTKYID